MAVMAPCWGVPCPIDGLNQGVHELLRLPSRPTAIFARNDHTAFGVIQALREKGYRVPEDISVAGFDDVPLARQVVPALTTVSQPTVEQGRLAAEFLLGRIERPEERVEPRRLMLDCHLITRGSTARPKSARSSAAADEADETT